MRQNPNTRRSRGRGGRKPGNSRNQVFDSNGPGAHVRGNSAQIYEKYQQLARDATSRGDRVAAENYFQHAEHYYRLLETAGLNRNGSSQEDSQQRNDNRVQNGNAAQNDSTAQNNEAVVVTEAVSEPASQPASQPASEHAPESVAALIEAVEQGNTGRQDQAPSEATNGSGNSEDDAKPARRAKSRRPGGSANGQNAPDKDADAAPSEDDAEPASEDTNPVGA